MSKLKPISPVLHTDVLKLNLIEAKETELGHFERMMMIVLRTLMKETYNL